MLLTAGAGQAALVQLILRNGDRLTGSIVRETTNRLTLTNALLGEVSLPKDEIARREAAGIVSTNAPAAAPGDQRWQELQAAYVADQISGAEYYRQRAKLLAGATNTGGLSLVKGKAGGTNAVLSGGVPATALVNPAIGSHAPAAVAPKPGRQLSGEVFAGTDIAQGNKNRQLYTGRPKPRRPCARR